MRFLPNVIAQRQKGGSGVIRTQHCRIKMPLIFCFGCCRHELSDGEETATAGHRLGCFPQEVAVWRQEAPPNHPGLCQRQLATVRPDRHEGAVLPTQAHRHTSHHREQVPGGPPAAPTPHQTQHLPQLHHHLQRGDRLGALQ